MSPLPRSARWLYLTAVLVLIADQLSKAIVASRLAGGPPIVLVPGVLHLTYTTNTGGAFGLLTQLPWLFALATVIVSGVIVWQSSKRHGTGTAVALGLILGGALGNLTDRLAGGLAFDGTVTDFIDLRIWPVFNLADSAVVIGAILLVIANIRNDRALRRTDRGPSTEPNDPDDPNGETPSGREDGSDG